MKIVICDDNAVFGKDLVLQLKAAFMRKGYSIEIKSYNDPKDLIEAEDVNVNAYFLDIEMPGGAGTGSFCAAGRSADDLHPAL